MGKYEAPVAQVISFEQDYVYASPSGGNGNGGFTPSVE